MDSAVRVRVTPRYSDLDALGHVNYAVYLTYMEEAFLALWLHINAAVGLDSADYDIGCLTAHAEVDYRSPTAREPLDVSVWLSGLGRTSFSTSYRIESAETRRLVAEGKTIQVITFPPGDERASRVIGYLRTLIPTGAV